MANGTQLMINGVVVTPDTRLKCKYCGKEFTLTKLELDDPNVVLDVCKDEDCVKKSMKDMMSAELEKAKNNSPEADILKKATGN